MSTPPPTDWKYLEPRPCSYYRQLFIKGTRIRAEVIYGVYCCEDPPVTPEAIAADYGLPLEAVKEAIAYCESNPQEVADDRRREDTLAEASKGNKVLSPQEITRIMNS